MKILNGRSIGPATGARRPATAAAPGFAVAAEGAQKTAAAAGVPSVTALGAILALQAETPAAERRARQARRGAQALDVLEKLEHGLVLGRAPGSLRNELERVQRGAEATGEAGLDEVLREIDTRLAVEAAKLDRLVERG
jgi:hypothetical protein